jgi:hypothetical protein
MHEPRRHLARTGSVTSMVAAAAALAVWLTDLLTRPPCPRGYVRLVDVELVAPVVCGALAAHRTPVDYNCWTF